MDDDLDAYFETERQIMEVLKGAQPMKIRQFKCDVCGHIHQLESDMIFGYSMKKMDLYNQLEIIQKDRTDTHICIDCIDAIKKTPIPSNLI